MPGLTPWTCPSCAESAATLHCPACGEKNPQLHDLTLRGMAHQAVEAFSSVDARLWRTLKVLLRRPGDLTLEYQRGARRPYIGPVPLFLLANVLLVAMEFLPGSNMFAATLFQHLHNQPWSPLAQSLVADRLADENSSLDAYAPVFDQVASRNAQSLVIVMVLACALELPAMFWRNRTPFAVHLAFSFHLFAIMLLLVSAALLIPTVDLWLGGTGLARQVLDRGIAIGVLLACACWAFVAIGRVYGGSRTSRFAKAVVLSAVLGAIVLGYRFALFILTLYTT